MYIKKTKYEMEQDAYVRASLENFSIDIISNREFIVHNIDNNSSYIVEADNYNYLISCTCPHFIYRNVLCKHIVKVSMDYNLEIGYR